MLFQSNRPFTGDFFFIYTPNLFIFSIFNSEQSYFSDFYLPIVQPFGCNNDCGFFLTRISTDIYKSFIGCLGFDPSCVFC